MSSSGPDPVERDSRGILDPWLLRQRVRLSRYPAGPVLDGLVDRFWAVRWDLPPGTAHRQQVLTHPGANVSVGHANGERGQRQPGPVEARLYGVARGLSTRVLVGQGWTVAALMRPGGLGAFVSGSAADFTDRAVPLGQALGTDEAALLRRVTAGPDEAARVALLEAALEHAVNPERKVPAARVAEVARLAEADRAVRRLGDLCERAGLAGTHPAADVPAVRRRVADLGDPPLPAAGGGRVGPGRNAGVVGGGSRQPGLRRPGPPDPGLPCGDRPDARGLR